MTGYTTLTSHTYVAAYQAELRADLHNAGSSRRNLRAVNRLAERWLTRTGPSGRLGERLQPAR
jgi:hypothetical protein